MRKDVFIQSAKELIRHAITKLGAHAIFDRIRPQSAVKGEVLNVPSRQDRFVAIYKNGLWQHDQNVVPGSGEGSSLAATAALRSELPRMLDSLHARTIIDLGCGDYTWMRTLDLSQNYIGVDVVPSVIENNQRNFSDAKHAFICMDVAENELPDGDAIFCREILFHLSFSDIQAVLRNCGRKPRRYLFATTDSSTLVNADIRSGDFRRLNLRRSPFSFPEPDRVIEDDAVEKGRKIGIWTWDRLPIF
jgi:hypothetical protein